MLVSLEWLKDYVNTQDLAPELLAEKITRSGIEVDAVIDRANAMEKVVVGYVVSKEKHPEADKLNICQVDVGEEEPQQIICGAPNVDAGQKVIVARPGAHLPGGIKIKKAKLRGHESNGMICSLQELGIEGKLVPKAYSEGIYVLPEDAQVGTDALAILGLRDTVLELGLTPNRSDALSMLGVAYEVGAILSEEVKYPDISYQAASEKAEDLLKLRVEDMQANPMYVAKVVKNVKIGESPMWLQNRLMAAGVRPHNNVVDVTNYVLMEYGQPLHAFDYDSLATGEIVLEGTCVVDDLDKTPARVVVSPDFINERLGMKIALEDMLSILERLKFGVEAANGLLIIDAPTRRQDIKIEEDIVEEIARLYGYDEIPTTLPEGATQVGSLTAYQANRRVVRNYMEGAGLYQAVTYSLTSDALSQRFALKAEPVTRLLMPMSEERSTLRQSLVPHLIEAAAYNVARQADSVALYEIGSVFLGQSEEGQPFEEEHLAAVLTGKWLDHAWQGEKKAVDFFVLKGVIEGVIGKLGLGNRISFEKAQIDGLHPGRTASIVLDGEQVGIIGGLHPAEEKAWGVKDTYVMEMNLVALLNATDQEAPLSYKPVPRFPAMSRDIALIMDRTTTAGEVVKAINVAGVKLLKDIRVFDVYEGEKMEQGKKSVAFSLTYFDPERTLTDEEVVAAHNKVLKAIATIDGTEVR